MNAAKTTPSELSLINADRRSHKRFSVSRPGKLFRRSTQQYAPVVTRNLSFSGALLEVDGHRPFNQGELIDLAVSLRNQALVPDSSMVKAIVTRAEAPVEGRQTVAVRYIQPAGLAAAA
jgi:hypothetical protein